MVESVSSQTTNGGTVIRGEFVAFIEQRRKEQNLTKKALAKKAGLSRQALYKILNGDVRQPYSSTIVSLANALKVAPDTLLQKLFGSKAQ